MASLRNPSASGCFRHSRRLAALVPTVSAHCVQFAPPYIPQALVLRDVRRHILFFTLAATSASHREGQGSEIPTCDDSLLIVLDQWGCGPCGQGSWIRSRLCSWPWPPCNSREMTTPGQPCADPSVGEAVALAAGPRVPDLLPQAENITPLKLAAVATHHGIGGEIC